MSPLRIPIEERFWSRKVQKGNGCWSWTAGKNRDGYGTFHIGRKTLGAHRVAYELTYGPIPPGMLVDHTCHNRMCVNPEHLRLATKKQNNENLSGLTKANTSGVRGVYWNTREGKWAARVGHHGKKIFVGYFTDLAEAERAVIAKRNEIYTHNDLDREQAA